VSDHFLTDRRTFLAVAGLAAAVAAGACGSDDDGAEVAATTSTAAPNTGDVALLRTASSIEELEVALCQRAIDGGLLKSAAANDVVKLFQAQHKQHAGVLEGHTTRFAGEPYTQPNPALLQQFQARVTDEASLLRALYDLAQMSAATCQAAVGTVRDSQLNVVLMSIAGAEARQAAVLGAMTNQPVAAASLAPTDRAVAPGTGL
jgi:hypothetical protein